MNNNSNTELESAQSGNAQVQKHANNSQDKESNDFIIGLVTFIVFIIFMTAWMYFAV